MFRKKKTGSLLLALMSALALLIAPSCTPAEEKNYAESYARGIQALADGDYSAAAQELTEAMVSQDEESPVWVRRGDAYRAMELYEDAASDYEHALALDETLFDVYDKLAECYRRLGDARVAEDVLARRDMARQEAYQDDAD
jgi:tetratricopeptide (TPR) repeat protein